MEMLGMNAIDPVGPERSPDVMTTSLKLPELGRRLAITKLLD
jgi:hypothetical protein